MANGVVQVRAGRGSTAEEVSRIVQQVVSQVNASQPLEKSIEATVADKELLSFDGTVWKNRTAAEADLLTTSAALGDLSDVDLTGAAEGAYVRLSATDWVDVTVEQIITDIVASANGFIKKDGTIPLTADWDAGSNEIRAASFYADTGHVGVDVAPNANVGIFYEETLALDVNTEKFGVQSRVVGEKTVSTRENAILAMLGRSVVGANNTQNWSNALPYQAIGVEGAIQVDAGSSGTIKGMMSFMSKGVFFNGAGVTNYYGLYHLAPQNSFSKIVNNYGIYLEPVVGGTGSNYAIYTAGGPVSHVGQLQLPTAGSGAGVVLGGDVALFRGAANRLDLGLSDTMSIGNSGTITPSGNLFVEGSGTSEIHLYETGGTRWKLINTGTEMQIDPASGADRILYLLNSGVGSFTLDVDGTLQVDGGAIMQDAALATNATAGFMYIPTCAGVPTGTPGAHTGTVAMVYDTTNDALYVYNGGWVSSAFA